MQQTLKPLLVLLFLVNSGCFFAQKTNQLNGYDEELELHDVVWGCSCPNWVTLNDFRMYENDKLIDHCMYLEPATDSLVLPDDFDPSVDVLKVKGQYYQQKGYPKGFVISEENEKEATIFRFSDYWVEKGKTETDSGLKFSCTAKDTGAGVEASCDVLNTTDHDIYFLTTSCAGYQDATICNENEFSMLKIFCNVSHPVVIKIEPQKSYHFRVLLISKGEAKEVKLGFEMRLVDKSLYETKMDWETMRKTAGEQIVLWSTSQITETE